MNRIKSLHVVAILFCIALSPVYAEGVHKWVDENGVTHYSDAAPNSSATKVTIIEVHATYAATNAAEQNYYSIMNQWMRLHEERIEREKIKLEKAKQKAALQPVAPQVIYVNEPSESRYIVPYTSYLHPNHPRHRFQHKSNRHFGDQHRRGGRSGRLLGYGRRLDSSKQSLSRHRKASGLTLSLH